METPIKKAAEHLGTIRINDGQFAAELARVRDLAGTTVVHAVRRAGDEGAGGASGFVAFLRAVSDLDIVRLIHHTTQLKKEKNMSRGCSKSDCDSLSFGDVKPRHSSRAICATKSG